MMTEPACYALVKAGTPLYTLPKADQKLYFEWICRPKFSRMLGRHRASDWSFGYSQARKDIEEGYFGHVAAYWCSDCKGPCGEPEYHMTHRQTLEQPEEGVNICPSCGSEECGENTDGGQPFTAIRRYSTHRNPSYRQAS